MVSTRFLGLASTVLLVVGALAFGEALHRTVVTNQAPLTSPLMVVYFVVGAACIVAGYRVRQPVGRRYALGSDDERDGTERPGAGSGGDSGSGSGSGVGPGPGSAPGSGAERSDDGEFDPRMSPLGDAAPGDGRASDDGEDAADREAAGDRSRNRGAGSREGRNGGDDGA